MRAEYGKGSELPANQGTVALNAGELKMLTVGLLRKQWVCGGFQNQKPTTIQIA